MYALRKLPIVRLKQLVFRLQILFALSDGLVPVTCDWHLELHVFDRLVRPGNRLKLMFLHRITIFRAEPELSQINLLCYIYVACVFG